MSQSQSQHPAPSGKTRPPTLHEAAPQRLSGARLSLALFRIGWSEMQAAERCQMHRTQLRRCTAGTSFIPPDLTTWILALETAHMANPCPRQRRSDPAFQETVIAH